MSTTKPSCASLRNPEIRMFESAREENQTMGRPRLDPATSVATVIALVMVVVYVWIMRQQSDRPAAWFLTALLLGVAAAGYGTNRAAPRRGAAPSTASGLGPRLCGSARHTVHRISDPGGWESVPVRGCPIRT